MNQINLLIRSKQGQLFHKAIKLIPLLQPKNLVKLLKYLKLNFQIHFQQLVYLYELNCIEILQKKNYCHCKFTLSLIKTN